jgi:hypothetical protein
MFAYLGIFMTLSFKLKSEKFADYEDFSADINGTVTLIKKLDIHLLSRKKGLSMLNKIAFAGILSLIVMCSGCTVPCHPYDYCGPVYDGCCDQCNITSRTGSILSDGDIQPASAVPPEEMIPESVSNGEQNAPVAGEYEGATHLLSVTDRKVDDSEVTANTRPAAAEPQLISAQPTAVRHR